jgi:hypothetical protein
MKPSHLRFLQIELKLSAAHLCLRKRMDSIVSTLNPLTETATGLLGAAALLETINVKALLASRLITEISSAFKKEALDRCSMSWTRGTHSGLTPLFCLQLQETYSKTFGEELLGESLPSKQSSAAHLRSQKRKARSGRKHGMHRL